MNGWSVEALALATQCGLFMAGLAVSLLVGMVLAAHLDGVAGLLLATVISGAGLLTAAALSQSLKDWMVQRSLDPSDDAPAPDPSASKKK
jgi:hypothetical protein